MGFDFTKDLEDAKQHVVERGVAILPGVLSDNELQDIGTRLRRAIKLSEQDGVPTRGYPFDPDCNNQRVFHLFNLDPLFIDLIQRPVALAFVRLLLGNDFLISNFSANITEPGNAAMAMHADQGYVPSPWPHKPLACNVAWLLDDFTADNGGTCYVPDSHLIGHGPDDNVHYETLAIEAPAGSLMIMDGRLWHQTGQNRTADGSRAALFGYYVQRWIRPQMSWNTTLWPETIQNCEPEFLHLLGFYTGNVEYQIPHGQRASAHPPSTLLKATEHRFALGPRDTD